MGGFSSKMANSGHPMAPSTPPLLPQSWDSHVHCFNPDRFPFSPSRAYTPDPAPLDALLDASLADNIMIVQATIEDGPANMLYCLSQAQHQHPQRTFRATIASDPDPDSKHALHKLNDTDFQRLHHSGVRSIRIHGSYGGSGSNLDWVRQQLRDTAQLYPVRNLGWSISAQLPLESWAALAADIESLSVPIIADHNGAATPPDVGSPAFKAFLGMLSAGRINVKLGALHRRATNDDINTMSEVIRQYAQAAPSGIIWGSDWPHVDTSKRGLDPSPPLQVDTTAEVDAIRSWLSEEQWHNMLVTNPARLFE